MLFICKVLLLNPLIYCKSEIQPNELMRESIDKPCTVLVFDWNGALSRHIKYPIQYDHSLLMKTTTIYMC
jgi:hypothetical protein